jgi:excisionase family DNA binding protein
MYMYFRASTSRTIQDYVTTELAAALRGRPVVGEAADSAPLLLKVGEAARLLGTSAWTVYRMVEDGTLPSIRLRRRGMRIPRKALDEFIALAK